jgi:hypothetical protein
MAPLKPRLPVTAPREPGTRHEHNNGIVRSDFDSVALFLGRVIIIVGLLFLAIYFQ